MRKDGDDAIPSFFAEVEVCEIGELGGEGGAALDSEAVCFGEADGRSVDSGDVAVVLGEEDCIASLSFGEKENRAEC